MQTNFENKIPVITNELQHANSYLESEKLVISTVKEQIKDGVPMTVIDENLKKLYAHINKLIMQKNTIGESINFKYAAACLNTLITTPYWHSWIEIVKP
jgi:hypothetical protein